MSVNKRFFWLKLKEDFFEDDTIQWIEEQKNGKEYTLFYLKMCLKSLKTDGSLIRFVGENVIPYDMEFLAKITNTDIDTVVVAMELFKKIGLVAVYETGEIYINRIKEMAGSETDKAEAMRISRAKNKLGNNVTGSYQNVNQSIEKEKEIKSIDSKTKIKKSKYGEYNNVLLTDKHITELKELYTDYENKIENLSEYIETTGKVYKNHFATIKAWARKDEAKKESKAGYKNKANDVKSVIDNEWG